MNNAAYVWQTPEYSYDFIPVENNLIRVKSETKEAIDAFLSTIELSGPEEDTELPSTIIEETQNSYDVYYFVEVSRATVSLFLDFEVRYYMGVPTP